MTHIVRDVDRPGSKLHKKEVAEAGAGPAAEPPAQLQPAGTLGDSWDTPSRGRKHSAPIRGRVVAASWAGMQAMVLVKVGDWRMDLRPDSRRNFEELPGTLPAREDSSPLDSSGAARVGRRLRRLPDSILVYAGNYTPEQLRQKSQARAVASGAVSLVASGSLFLFVLRPLVGTYSAENCGDALLHVVMLQAVTILEAPPMVVVGLVGYVETPRGLRALTTVWAGHLSEECRRRFYKAWHKSKKKAFTKYGKKWADASKNGDAKPMEAEISRAKKYCQVIRAICHTQVSKVKIGAKKAVIKEIQVNGGTTEAKVDW
ncbi:unnamed protein product, partial [Prorocentrum cordatum]